MAWKIQLAFEGGGARFIQHLAVASAFQELEKFKIIEITRVAGTSAGALAAAIVASGISADAAARVLTSRKNEFVSKLRMPNMAGAISRFCIGSSLVNSKNLEEVFRSMWVDLLNLSAENKQETVKPNRQSHVDFSGKELFTQYIEHLPKPLIIVATDIVHRKSHEFTGKDELIDSLVHSCAIPVVYRNIKHIKHSNNLVDGGLVENLPLDTLASGREKYGDIVAISFKEAEKYLKPKNMLQYLSLLYNVASKYNIEHIRKKIDNNLIFPIKTDIEPLDFETAFTDFGAHTSRFTDLQKEATIWIKNRARASAPVPKNSHKIWVDEDPPSVKLMELNGDIFKSLYANVKYRIIRRDIIVKAFSLLRHLMPGDPRGDQPDEVYQIHYIAPVDQKIHCIPLRLDWTGQDAANPVRTIEVESGNPSIRINPILCPAKGIYAVKDGDKMAEVVLYFNPPLDPDDTLTHPTVVRDFCLLYGVMEDLCTDRISYIGIRNHAATAIEEARLILAVPGDCPHIGVGWRDAESPNLYVTGEGMTATLLASDYAYLGGGFRKMGWRAFDVPPGKGFSARLSLTNAPHPTP